MSQRLIANTLRAYLRHGPGGAQLATRLNDHLTRHPVTITAHTVDGVAFPNLNTTDIIQRYLYLFGTWEPHLTAWIRRRLAPGDTFIDVGANIGYYSLLAAHLVGPTGRVVAVEPSPHFGRTLAAAAHANNLHHIRIVRAAAYDTTDQVTFYTPSTANLGNTTHVRPRRCAAIAFQAEARPLPSLTTGSELAQARIIKIDAEGAEAAIVRGLTPALDHLRPSAELVIEITPRLLAKQGLAPTDVTGPLTAAGFHAYRLDNDYAASAYPRAQRHPIAPRRWHEPIADMSDIIFSRVNAAFLP
ncbi:FkbM family methyltransferase [Plantactinospora soyae]|uniref:FkbM family methyltransferase n=1 Tax=Plantactinospora soyae TaxID=1544732 RepID=A0A927QUV3_9ACTN|nr:FkbM family methyltransferase [Plantactinospora soyae]MBE1484995.1 FkbM family methyltransferase [Plantactinospora soyae]